MTQLERRIDRLEDRAGIGDERPPVASFILGPGDSEDAAMAEYRAKHPELDGKEISWLFIHLVGCKKVADVES